MNDLDQIFVYKINVTSIKTYTRQISWTDGQINKYRSWWYVINIELRFVRYGEIEKVTHRKLKKKERLCTVQ